MRERKNIYDRMLVPALLCFAGALLLASPVAAVTPFDALASSSDTTVDLSGAVVNDEDVSEDDGNSVLAPIGPPGIPTGSDLTGYHRDGGDDLFSVDTTAELPGAVTVGPRDVVRWDGVSYAPEFDGSANGVPGGDRIDSISVEDSTVNLILSFDVTVDLGGGLVAADEDLVAFDGISFAQPEPRGSVEYSSLATLSGAWDGSVASAWRAVWLAGISLLVETSSLFLITGNLSL